MKSKSDDGVLERNVTTLLESGGETPQLADAARARIRARLVEQHGTVPGRARLRSPLIAVGFGLAATAAGALVITQLAKDEPGSTVAADRMADGTTWITDTGGHVTPLGARRVRVEGAALLDVAPGKGAFIVETKRGEIQVIGTRFLVDAQPDRTTTAVVRGSVLLASSDGKVTLHAGEQGVAEPGRPPTRGPAPRLSHLVSWAAAARRKQETDVKPLRNGTLFARDPNAPWVPESPLPISKLTVDVVIEDQVARVALDQTFHNPSPQVMEGMYRFAIPPDASLQRLAMYVEGVLTESAVVERMAARRIYEDIVYRRLDPALLEWAGTGRLSLRVYPLPARQDKRLLVAYTQSLPRLYDDWTLTVPLPEVDLPVGELGFDVRIRGCANCEVTSTSHKLVAKPVDRDAVVSVRAANATIGDSLVLHVRDPRKQPVTAAHQVTANGTTESYLMVRARPELANQPRGYKPRTWVILDDVSASRDAMARRAQADLIDGFLRELDEDDRVAVVAFDVAARTKLQLTRVLDVDRKTVRAALNEEGGVGATDFHRALDAALALLGSAPPDDAMIVYLGDGVITSGARNLDTLRGKLAGKMHFIGVGVGDGPDTQTLESRAAATGGYATTVDLADDVGWRAFDLVAALHTPRVAGLEARLVDAAGAVVPATTYIKTPQLADGEELELVARLAGTGTPAFAELTGTVNGAPWRQRVAIAPTASEAGYLPRLWAQRHIAARLLAKHDAVVVPPCVAPVVPAAAICQTEQELRAARDEEIRKDVVALGKKYFVLSRHTSLLVLENDAMYKQYGVEKGSGDTWARYEVPVKIPVQQPVAGGTPTDIADDAVLVRTPLQVFYNQGGYIGGSNDGWAMHARAFDSERSEFPIVTVTTPRPTLRARSSLQLAPPAPPVRELSKREEEKTADKPDSQANFESSAQATTDAPADLKQSRTEVSSGEISGTAGYGVSGLRGGGRFATVGAKSGKAAGWGAPAAIYPQRLGYPHDAAFDDVTAFVPAFLADTADTWRTDLQTIGGKKPHPIDAGARDLLSRARKALPSGVYRWGELELAVDGARRIGWKRTTDHDLAETASFDGTTLTRRYAELGLDVTRTYGDDDVAISMGYLPIWIADPAHYARWFEVGLRGKREVTLSRRDASRPAELQFVLVFDDRDHLVAIRDAKGKDVLAVTWSAAGPVSARAAGVDVSVQFSGQAIADATAWAHAGAVAGVAIELPMHLPKFWEAKAKALTAGSPQWRHVLRQRMASLAAIGDRTGLFATYSELLGAGGVELGDLSLAGTGIVAGTTDAQFAVALTPFVTSKPALAAYLRASRAYAQRPKTERLKVQSSTGFVGALWSLREITALLAADKGKEAVEHLMALGQRAFEFRLVAVSATQNRGSVSPANVARAWDSVAIGDYKNVARAQAASALMQRGASDLAAERVVALVEQLDLTAMPPSLQQLRYQFASSRRGNAGWQLVWAKWRDRVLAGNSFEHTMSLVPMAAEHPLDLPGVLGRAAALAADDVDRVLAVAQLATTYGQPALAQALIEPMAKAKPSRELHQMIAQFAIQQGNKVKALEHLEAAQQLGADEEVSLAVVRGELAQILTLSREVALQATGAERARAVKRAMDWGNRWRAIDTDNGHIDRQVGELQLAVGNHAEAWRQLSSVIERDPMSGDGYQAVATAFEAQGKVVEAIEYWNQAMLIDQTNPSPRLRKAQALIATGKIAEGDKLLADIAGRTWHARWEGVRYQAKSLLDQAKAQEAQQRALDGSP
ncbi:MAG: VIT domain-containing protein [Kofleriaceae bacterium]